TTELRRSASPEQAAAAAAHAAVADIRPTGDVHGSSEYRRDLIEALVRRAVLRAAGRAGEDGHDQAAR
ncbi:MAG: FAD binding domain-containing protein, partial [Solirubrobacteraceae bacterium]